MTSRKPDHIFCDIKNRHEHCCGDPARFAVYYYDDGTGLVKSCRQHLARAVEAVKSDPNVTKHAAVKVVAI